MQVSYSSYAFITFTYDRSLSLVDNWSQVSRDYNRYIQKLRRLHNDSKIQYIRTIESHEDGYPHIHSIIRFPHVLTIQDGKYFDRRLHKKWKQLWTSGHSDYKTTQSNGNVPIRYLLKYISKSSHTYKTMWSRYYEWINRNNPSTANTAKKPTSSTQTGNSTTSQNSMSPSENQTAPTDKDIQTSLFCSTFHIKQLSWSRDFWKLTSSLKARRPETITSYTSAP